MSQRINVHIDVLHVAEPYGRPELLGEEMRTELRRRLEERRLPPTAGTHIDTVEAPPIDGTAGSSLGVAVARAVYEGMKSNETDTS